MTEDEKFQVAMGDVEREVASMLQPPGTRRPVVQPFDEARANAMQNAYAPTEEPLGMTVSVRHMALHNRLNEIEAKLDRVLALLR